MEWQDDETALPGRPGDDTHVAALEAGAKYTPLIESQHIQPYDM